MQAPGPGIRRLLVVSVLATVVIGCAQVTPPGDRPPSSSASDGPASPSQPASASPSAQPPEPPASHVAAGLALVRFPDDGRPVSEIFVVEQDGDLRQVTGLRGGDLAAMGATRPVWSPDGRRIAYGPSALGSGSFPAVLVVNANGRQPRLVAELDAEEFSTPSWSSDGTQLLYGDATPPGDRRLWLADLASGDVRRIGTGAAPRWLPDGEGIVFVRGVEGRVPSDPAALTQVVFVADVPGGEPREFAVADNVHWAPDGEALLIETEGKLILADGDGNNSREVAEGALPIWSADGTRFAYLSGHDQDGRSLVAVMDRSGDELWSGVAGSAPSWSNDGSRLAVELTYPEPMVQALDAATGELLWEAPGLMPAWRP
jgi:Tol biopolymer transport system component